MLVAFREVNVLLAAILGVSFAYLLAKLRPTAMPWRILLFATAFVNVLALLAKGARVTPFGDLKDYVAWMAVLGFLALWGLRGTAPIALPSFRAPASGPAG